MRRTRVCLYGGTDLQGMPPDFVSALAFEILSRMHAKILTGGFLHSSKRPHVISTDSAALDGARRYAESHGVDLQDVYEAWIPGTVLEKRPDLDGARRMTEDAGIGVRRLAGRTALGRRLTMVREADIVVTISGGTHTELVGEQAIELGTPLLPIPTEKGRSKRLLRAYRDHVERQFADGELETCLRRVRETIRSTPTDAAAAVVALLQTAKVGRCLVLLPYDTQHDELYASTIEPAISHRMTPVRLDQVPSSDAIFTNFIDAVEAATAVIADVTQLNENVMYEVGYARGKGLAPLVYTMDPARLKDLPLYFQTINVRVAADGAELERLIDDYLRHTRLTGRTSER